MTYVGVTGLSRATRHPAAVSAIIIRWPKPKSQMPKGAGSSHLLFRSVSDHKRPSAGSVSAAAAAALRRIWQNANVVFMTAMTTSTKLCLHRRR